MKKIFLFAFLVVTLFSCKKSDTSGGGTTVSPSANFVKSIIVRVPGQSGIDTLNFVYDTQGRLIQYHEAGVDTTNPAISYYFDNFDFNYPTGGNLPTEYSYYDINNSSRVDILSYDINGQFSIDSTIGSGYLQVTNNNKISSNIFYSYGDAYYSDSLSFTSGNITQWAEDSVLDATVSPTVLSRSFLTTYNSYTTNSNPLSNLYPLASLLFENGSVSIAGILDPVFLYSKNLPSTETYAGFAVSYQYSLSGTKVVEVMETFDGSPYNFYFYY